MSRQSATLERPPPHPAPAGARTPATDGQLLGDRQDTMVGLAVLVLVAAACLPFARIYVGIGVMRPILAAALLSVGVAWMCRRLRLGPLSALVVSAVGWALFTGLVFLSDTLAAGLIPTLETFGAGRDLWLRGVELVRIRPAPALPEAGLVLVTVTGVWWVAHAVEGLVFRLQAPLRAIGMSMLLWAVPLAIDPNIGRAWAWAAPYLAAAALLLLVFGAVDLQRWAGGRGGQQAHTVPASGWLIGLAAIVAGGLLGGLLPGFEDPPYYEVRSLGGTTITTNPIVSIRSSLVNLSDQPVAQVRTPEPVYLRLTALDVYSDLEEWTSQGIRGGAASGQLPMETPTPHVRELEAQVEVADLSGAIIVPAPYHPARIDGEAQRRFQFDPNGATITLGGDAVLHPGDTYAVSALVPDPPAEELAAAGVDGAPADLTALPASVPSEVAELARDIVAAAGASTPFEQALAIQDELRSWEYSLEPPRGHGSSAMRSFITNRIGYCEQYAGTMAVMMRTLGIPARVAVGFTPGALVEPDPEVPGAGVYRVTHANAHAWVEVLFPGLGWVAFEPTPRTDGNVIVPSSADAAPGATEGQQAQAETDPVPSLPDPVAPDEIPDAIPPDAADQDPGAGAGADPGDDGGQPLRLALVLLLLVAVAGALLVRQRRGPEGSVPADRVLSEVDRVRRIGHGTGRGVEPSETDREYLRRLTGLSPAAEVLAAAAERARYAPLVPAEDAAAAREAAVQIVEQLLAGRGAAARAIIRVRAPVSMLARRWWRDISSRASAASWQVSGDRMRRLIRRRSARGHG